jgi:hypothetical protein
VSCGRAIPGVSSDASATAATAPELQRGDVPSSRALGCLHLWCESLGGAAWRATEVGRRAGNHRSLEPGRTPMDSQPGAPFCPTGAPSDRNNTAGRSVQGLGEWARASAAFPWKRRPSSKKCRFRRVRNRGSVAALTPLGAATHRRSRGNGALERLTRRLGEQEVHEALRGRLGFMIGQSGAFVRLDDGVLRPIHSSHDQVQSDYGDVEGLGRSL